MSPAPSTIFALSSGRLPAAIAVVRISGPRAGDALKALIGRLPEPRQAALARVRDAAGETIDQALALWFPGPNSETGEDLAELQLHGGRAVVAAVFGALATRDGLRLAEPGEFTRRAFENGKLDLTRVEGLADLIYADTEAQRRQAVRQLRGLLGDRAEAWRTRLVEALALVEAAIDFPDEGDVPKDLIGPARKSAYALKSEIEAVLAEGRRGERLREGLVVAIAGPPNAGKSSLLNRIARREAAIVSPFAGTTRDVIEVHLDLDGSPVTLLDTAGMRDSDDPVEQEGVRRARERAGGADLVLWVVDSGGDESLTMYDGASQFLEASTWLIRNKSDLVAGKNDIEKFRFQIIDDRPTASPSSVIPGPAEDRKPDPSQPDRSLDAGFAGSRPRPGMTGEGARVARTFSVSAKTGEGIDTLLAALTEHARELLGSTEPALVTRERQRQALEDTAAALARALADDRSEREELLAEELRLAARSLGRLIGRVDVEDILDVIFRDFCIGK
jgi:tRNA modification GTPase